MADQNLITEYTDTAYNWAKATGDEGAEKAQAWLNKSPDFVTPEQMVNIQSHEINALRGTSALADKIYEQASNAAGNHASKDAAASAVTTNMMAAKNVSVGNRAAAFLEIFAQADGNVWAKLKAAFSQSAQAATEKALYQATENSVTALQKVGVSQNEAQMLMKTLFVDGMADAGYAINPASSPYAGVEKMVTIKDPNGPDVTVQDNTVEKPVVALGASTLAPENWNEALQSGAASSAVMLHKGLGDERFVQPDVMKVREELTIIEKAQLLTYPGDPVNPFYDKVAKSVHDELVSEGASVDEISQNMILKIQMAVGDDQRLASYPMPRTEMGAWAKIEGPAQDEYNKGVPRGVQYLTTPEFAHDVAMKGPAYLNQISEGKTDEEIGEKIRGALTNVPRPTAEMIAKYEDQIAENAIAGANITTDTVRNTRDKFTLEEIEKNPELLPALKQAGVDVNNPNNIPRQDIAALGLDPNAYQMSERTRAFVTQPTIAEVKFAVDTNNEDVVAALAGKERAFGAKGNDAELVQNIVVRSLELAKQANSGRDLTEKQHAVFAADTTFPSKEELAGAIAQENEQRQEATPIVQAAAPAMFNPLASLTEDLGRIGQANIGQVDKSVLVTASLADSKNAGQHADANMDKSSALNLLG